MNADEMRNKFEELASNDGKWVRAIERNSEGDYILILTNVAWKWFEIGYLRGIENKVK